MSWEAGLEQYFLDVNVHNHPLTSCYNERSHSIGLRCRISNKLPPDTCAADPNATFELQGSR